MDTFKPGSATLDTIMADLRYGRITAEQTIERLTGTRMAFTAFMEYVKSDSDLRDAIGRELDATDFLIEMINTMRSEKHEN